jgi:tripartite ATP-independent transporter DctM subunit
MTISRTGDAKDNELKTKTKNIWTAFDLSLDWLLLILLSSSLVVTLLQVFLRYFLNNPLTWSEEYSRFSFLWLVFIGSGVVIRKQGHICIDTFVKYLPAGIQRWIELFVFFAITLICIALVTAGYQLAIITWPTFSMALQWPVGLFYGSVAVGGALMLLNLLRQRPYVGDSILPGIAILIIAGLFYYLFFIRSILVLPELNPSAVLLVSAFVLLLLGAPVAFSMALGALMGYWVGGAGQVPMTALPHQLANGVDSFLLLAIPFFLLAAELMNAGGIMVRLFRLCTVLVGHIMGGLGHVNILASLLFGGMSGSGAADASATSKILVPIMEKQGYSRPFSCAVTSASSILSNLIPPSIAMMIYASITWVSVGRLFFAGVLPGILMALCMMLVVHIVAKKRGYKGIDKRPSFKDVLGEFKENIWVLGMPVIILGGLRFGVVTPTEAAAVAALYAFIVGMFVYRELKVSHLPKLIIRAAGETAVIMLILGISMPFNWLLTAEQIPQIIAEAVVQYTNNPWVFLLIINLFLFLVGLPIETFPAIIILMPILGPILPQFGIDPVHFGVIFIANLLIGPLTPPVGLLVFITASVAKCSPMDVFKELFPFIGIMIIGLLLITYVPKLSLWLPELLMKSGF